MTRNVSLNKTAQPATEHSPAPTLQQHWRGLVEAVGATLRESVENAPNSVTGLVVVRASYQPQVLRLTNESGPQLQSAILQRLKTCLRPVDHSLTVGYWEWLVVLPNLTSSVQVVLAMMKMQRQLGEPPFRLPNVSKPISFSFGAAIFPESGDDPQHLIQSARIAAIAADHEPDRYALYNPAMETTDEHAQVQLDELRVAISVSALKLYLQPQIDVMTRQCKHAEALLRWRLKDGTEIAAPDAIAMVEQGGLRPRFNRWLVQQGVQAVARLEEEGIRINVSLNLTANDLLDPDLPDLVEHTLALWHVAPLRVLFEITETVVVADTEEVARTLDRLRALGVRLAIDDFGTGYAGMSYLSRLPVQEVKIDQSFVRRINESPTDYEIIASVSALAHRLGMEIVAEGVETEAVFETVKLLGCDRIQGYLFARPLPESEFVTWWKAHHAQLDADKPNNVAHSAPT